MNLQGLGLLLLDAVRSLDIYLVMGSVLMGSVLLLVGNLLADIALVAVDPRVDFSSMGRMSAAQSAAAAAICRQCHRRARSTLRHAGMRREWRLASWPVRSRCCAC